MTFVLCGLDIEAKAALVREQLDRRRSARTGWSSRLARTDHPDAGDTEAASALLHVHLKDGDPRRAGRAFSAAAVELALASYPGCTLTTPPGDADARTASSRAEHVPQDAVAHVAVLPDGDARRRSPPPTDDRRSWRRPAARTAVQRPRSDGPTRRGAARARWSGPGRATRAATPTSASGRAPTPATSGCAAS